MSKNTLIQVIQSVLPMSPDKAARVPGIWPVEACQQLQRPETKDAFDIAGYGGTTIQ